MSELYVSIPGLSEIVSVDVNTNHSGATSTAVIQCGATTKSLGDSITIDAGYSTDHGTMFKGYIKGVDRKYPDSNYTITAHDVLIRAVDFFIASSNPENPFTRKNIKAETLIGQILALAGLTNYDGDNSKFIFGVRNPVEVNLVSVFDYTKMLADLLAWNIYADNTGKVIFENRKPFVMDGTLQQPGDKVDPVINSGDPITDSKGAWASFLNANYTITEKDTRNRIVVYGAEGVYAESKKATTFNPLTDNYEQILPTGFYKTAAAASEIIDTQSSANKAADYNLKLYNRMGVQIFGTITGKHDVLARKVVAINSTMLGVSGNFYVFSAEHNWSQQGYTTSIELRK